MKDRTGELSANYEEVSLVVLFARMFRRWRLILVVFICVFAAGALYALVNPERFQFVSLVQLGPLQEGLGMSRSEELVSLLESQWGPAAGLDLVEGEEKALSFTLEFSSPEGSRLVKITSISALNSKDLVEKVHQQLLADVTAHQMQELELVKARLTTRLNALDEGLRNLADSRQQETAMAMASLYERRAEVKARLEALGAAEVVAKARRAPESEGPAPLLIIVVGAFFALILALVAAFFAEFIRDVRRAM